MEAGSCSRLMLAGGHVKTMHPGKRFQSHATEGAFGRRPLGRGWHPIAVEKENDDEMGCARRSNVESRACGSDGRMVGCFSEAADSYPPSQFSTGQPGLIPPAVPVTRS